MDTNTEQNDINQDVPTILSPELNSVIKENDTIDSVVKSIRSTITQNTSLTSDDSYYEFDKSARSGKLSIINIIHDSDKLSINEDDKNKSQSHSRSSSSSSFEKLRSFLISNDNPLKMKNKSRSKNIENESIISIQLYDNENDTFSNSSENRIINTYFDDSSSIDNIINTFPNFPNDNYNPNLTLQSMDHTISDTRKKSTLLKAKTAYNSGREPSFSNMISSFRKSLSSRSHLLSTEYENIDKDFENQMIKPSKLSRIVNKISSLSDFSDTEELKSRKISSSLTSRSIQSYQKLPNLNISTQSYHIIPNINELKKDYVNISIDNNDSNLNSHYHDRNDSTTSIQFSISEKRNNLSIESVNNIDSTWEVDNFINNENTDITSHSTLSSIQSHYDSTVTEERVSSRNHRLSPSICSLNSVYSSLELDHDTHICLPGESFQKKQNEVDPVCTFDGVSPEISPLKIISPFKEFSSFIDHNARLDDIKSYTERLQRPDKLDSGFYHRITTSNISGNFQEQLKAITEKGNLRQHNLLSIPIKNNRTDSSRLTYREQQLLDASNGLQLQNVANIVDQDNERSITRNYSFDTAVAQQPVICDLQTALGNPTSTLNYNRVKSVTNKRSDKIYLTDEFGTEEVRELDFRPFVKPDLSFTERAMNLSIGPERETLTFKLNPRERITPLLTTRDFLGYMPNCFPSKTAHNELSNIITSLLSLSGYINSPYIVKQLAMGELHVKYYQIFSSNHLWQDIVNRSNQLVTSIEKYDLRRSNTPLAILTNLAPNNDLLAPINLWTNLPTLPEYVFEECQRSNSQAWSYIERTINSKTEILKEHISCFSGETLFKFAPDWFLNRSDIHILEILYQLESLKADPKCVSFWENYTKATLNNWYSRQGLNIDQLMTTISRIKSANPVLIFTSDPSSVHTHDTAIIQNRAQSDGKWINLITLSNEDIRTYMCYTLGLTEAEFGAMPDELVDYIVELSGGNPLYIREILFKLITENHISINRLTEPVFIELSNNIKKKANITIKKEKRVDKKRENNDTFINNSNPFEKNRKIENNDILFKEFDESEDTISEAYNITEPDSNSTKLDNDSNTLKNDIDIDRTENYRIYRSTSNIANKFKSLLVSYKSKKFPNINESLRSTDTKMSEKIFEQSNKQIALTKPDYYPRGYKELFTTIKICPSPVKSTKQIYSMEDSSEIDVDFFSDSSYDSYNQNKTEYRLNDNIVSIRPKEFNSISSLYTNKASLPKEIDSDKSRAISYNHIHKKAYSKNKLFIPSLTEKNLTLRGRSSYNCIRSKSQCSENYYSPNSNKIFPTNGLQTKETKAIFADEKLTIRNLMKKNKKNIAQSSEDDLMNQNNKNLVTNPDNVEIVINDSLKSIDIHAWKDTKMIRNSVSRYEALTPKESLVLKITACFDGPTNIMDILCTDPHLCRWGSNPVGSGVTVYLATRRLINTGILRELNPQIKGYTENNRSWLTGSLMKTDPVDNVIIDNSSELCQIFKERNPSVAGLLLTELQKFTHFVPADRLIVKVASRRLLARQKLIIRRQVLLNRAVAFLFRKELIARVSARRKRSLVPYILRLELFS